MEKFRSSEAFARSLDAADPLSSFRDKFYLPCGPDGKELIYFTGNSLGLQPRTVKDLVGQELLDWQHLGVEGHLRARNPWLPYHELLTEQMAEIVGAKPLETVVMNALTVNLHLLLVSFYRPDGERRKIMIEYGAFPSDQYAVKSQISFHGLDPDEDLIEIRPRKGDATLRAVDIADQIERYADSLSLVLLGGVNYFTGQAFDMKQVTALGHRAGARIGFDLAHAAGNVLLRLHDWNADFAAWCSYKYLNAGPGGVGGVFVHERHANRKDLPRFAGWWGHEKATRFNMDPEFIAIEGAEGWQLSNPPILQMAALRASLEIFHQAGMETLARKSEKLTSYLEFLIGRIADQKISVITPPDRNKRGCQLSIRVADADRGLLDSLSQEGVVADWREPDVIRVAPVPLYNTFLEVYRFAEILRSVLEDRSHAAV